jgi:peptidoglycan/LPS O-acetylase OafA/YrhL
MFAGAAGVALVGMAHSRVVGRLFDNRFFRYTATVSFGIYIWHYLLLHLMVYLTNGEFVYGNVHDPVRFAWLSATVLVLAYAVATLSWRFIEKPVLTSKWATR